MWFWSVAPNALHFLPSCLVLHSFCTCDLGSLWRKLNLKLRMRWNIKCIPSIRGIQESEPILEPWDISNTHLWWIFVSGPGLKCKLMKKALKLNTVQMQIWLAVVSTEVPVAQGNHKTIPQSLLSLSKLSCGVVLGLRLGCDGTAMANLGHWVHLKLAKNQGSQTKLHFKTEGGFAQPAKTTIRKIPKFWEWLLGSSDCVASWQR